jgi:hypothetical protein
MPKVAPIQNNFMGGEISPYFAARVDSERYQIALNVCLNYLPILEGGLTRRPGTMFANEVKDSTKSTRLVRFEFSTTQAYILEFGHNYIRFYRNNGQILNLGSPYEVATTYTEAELFELNFTQSADVLYIVHPSHKPAKLLRRGHADWLLQDIDFQDGPYNTTNSTSTTLAPSAATGTGVTLITGPSVAVTGAVSSGGLIKITATAHGKTTGDRVFIASVGGTVEANGTWLVTVIDADNFTLDGSTFVNAYTAGGTVVPGLFYSTDVGRFIRLKEGSTWGYGKITAFTNAGSVTIEVLSTLTNTNAKTNWRLGVFSGTTGYPATVVFHEDRLFFAGVSSTPQRIDGSRSGDYESFAPSDMDGTITASHAVSFSLNSNDVNVIRWLVSDEKGMLAGSVGGEWVIKSASPTEALSPTSITAKRATSYGSANIAPVQSGKAAIYIQRAGKKLREFNYFYDVDGFRATDLTAISSHISGEGLVQMAAQKEPQSFIWCVREDGVLACMTYDRDLDSLKVGWHRHILGGNSNAAGDSAAVESVAVIPSADGSRDELWLIVKRYINGQTYRYVEYLTKLFEDTDDQKEAFFVDCGLTYDSPLAISAITNANPAVVTSTAHGLSNGNTIILDEIQGMKETAGDSDSYLNNRICTVAGVTANTFQLVGVNSTTFTTYVTGGNVRKRVSTISGLDHLEGETVSILADGAVQPDKVVSGGSITLSTPAGTVHIGLGYNSDGQLPRIEAGAADGTALGKIRRINHVGVMLHRSLGLKLGPSFDDLTNIIFRDSADPMGRAPRLFTGIISEEVSFDYDFENNVSWRQDQPLPSTVLAILPRMVTQD